MKAVTEEMLVEVGATPLERAIIKAESSDEGYPLGSLGIIGDKHLWAKAYGPMQIRQPCVDDVNRVFKTKYNAEDCFEDLQLSVEIFRKYMSIWATPKRIGNAKGIVTDEDRARCWNGGPRGFMKKTTIVYWQKVSKYLQNL